MPEQPSEQNNGNSQATGPPSLQRNIAIIYALGFFSALQLIVPIFVPLLQGHGLSMAEILQTQAVFAFLIAALELPSGYLADMIGRKRVLLAGSIVAAAASYVMMHAQSFTDFLLFEALMGIAVSLTSGADIALLYDTRNALGHKASSNARVFGNLLSTSSVAECLAGVLASLLLMHSTEALLLCQFVLALSPIAIACLLVEPPQVVRTAVPELSLRQTLTVLLRERPLLLWIGISGVAFGSVGLFAFWTQQKYWQLAGIDMRYFGLIWAGFCLLRAIAANIAQPLEQQLGIKRLLVLLYLLPVLALATMAYAPIAFGVAAGLMFPLMRGIAAVILIDALNTRIAANYRASINSLMSLATRATFIVLAPILGYGIDAIGVRQTLIVLLVLVVPGLATVCIKLHSSVAIDRETQRAKHHAEQSKVAAR